MAKFKPNRMRMNQITRGAKLASGALKLYKNWKQTRSKSNYAPRSIASAPTTSQHEYATVYRKKRMPAGKRKAWKRFVRKSNAVIMKNAPLQTYVYSEGNHIYAAANQTGFYYCGLYGLNGPGRVLGTATTSGTGALNQMITLFTNFFATPVGHSINLESACMDLTLRNLLASTAIVEMYYIYPKRDIDDAELGVLKQTVEGMYIESFSATETIPGPGGVTALTLGTTPFNAPFFARHFQVYRKLRVQLGANEIFSTQMRNPRNYRLSYSDAQKYGMKKRMAAGIFFQIYGQPQSGLLTTQVTDEARVKVNINQVYNWRPVNLNRSGTLA